jgi:hypothetical protein
MRKISLIITLVIVTVMSVVSCNYLDKREETTALTEDEVFGNADNYEKYVEWLIQNPMIRYLQAAESPYCSWDDISDNSMSTISFTVPYLWAAAGDYLTMITAGRATMCNTDVWTRMWKHVRISNMGISHIDQYPGDEAIKNRILGQCYFHRAFAYFELCRRWGGMPYFREPLNLSDNLDYARDDMRTTYLNAAEDFKTAAEYLTPTVDDSYWQHPTSVAAMAMYARVMLYAASPQATTEGGIQRENLWEQAAEACDEAIKYAEDNGYALADGADYYYIFKGENSDVYTKEVLFGRRYQINWASAAYLQTIRPPGTLGGKYASALNQTFVDCFDMENGYPISDSRSGYNEQNPYVGRGLRFEHDVLYNGATPYSGRTMKIWNYTEGSNNLGSADVKYGADGSINDGYTGTGTYWRKFLGNVWNQPLKMVWPYIRMAELYLNYAEAATEAGWDIKTVSHNARYSPLEALNKIRNRAGIADLPEDYQNLESFKERVQNERRVELCFEDHRFYDIRRLLIGTKIDQAIYRVSITKLKKATPEYPTGFKYERIETPYRTHVYEDRNNLFPIYQDDTYKGKLFTQNPGW